MEISKIHQLFLKSSGITTDTRKIKPNTIFFALKGDNFNGNQYAKHALENGACFAIVDEEKYKTSDKHILVDNSLKTLQNLASFHRTKLNVPIIALTGSNGKTTTKELINSVLSTKYNTTATSGNLNNHIGVPLTLLSMDDKTEIGIVEMGANHIKEIEFLSSITTPDFGYITNIGKAHLEGFGSLEGVLKGKTELYRHIKENNKLIFLNTDDKKLTNAAKEITSYTFSNTTLTDASITLHKVNPMVEVLYKNVIIKSQLIGSYNFTNISAAIAIGQYFKIDSNMIKTAIESYSPTNNRSQIINKKNTTIILDAYNANPTSMLAALENFENLDYKSKTLFIGDMFELGNDADIEHQQIVDQIITYNFNQVILIGKNFYKTSCYDLKIQKYESYEQLEKSWNPNYIKDATLIKGSRGMQLERVLDLI